MEAFRAWVQQLQFGGVLDTAIVVLASLLCITFHETSHGFVAWKLGDPTAKEAGRLSLNPLAHFSPLGAVCFLLLGVGWATPVPVDARNFRKVSPRAGMALTAAAGPITNLLLAFLAVVGYKLLYYVGPVNTLTNLLLYVLNALAVMNLALAALNLLPVPPLDGSRLLGLALPRRVQYFIAQHEQQIFFVAIALLFLGLLDGPMAWIQSQLWRFLGWSTSFVEILLGLGRAAGTAV